jgi:hypothetical protein
VVIISMIVCEMTTMTRMTMITDDGVEGNTTEKKKKKIKMCLCDII